MKIFNIYLCALVVLGNTTITKTDELSRMALVKQFAQGPIGMNRAVAATCPICPSVTCIAPTAPTGCTGPGCTGCTTGSIGGFCCLDIIGNINVNNFSDIHEKIVRNNVSVGLNADIKQDLTVDEDATFVKNLCLERDLTVNQNVGIGGESVVIGILTVDQGATINGNVQINGNETVNGSFYKTGNVGISGSIGVGCKATFNGLLTASGGLLVYRGQTINDGGLIIENPSGCTGCTGAIITQNVCIIGDQLVTGDILVQDELTVDGIATFETGSIVTTATGNTLIANGPVIMNDGLTIAAGNQIINGGNLTVASGSLYVGGSSTLESQVTANAGAIIVGGLTVNGGQTIATGNLDVTVGNATIAGTLLVNGSVTSHAGVSSFKDLTITDTLNSCGPTGPAALVVDGGAGIAQDLWLGGCQYFTEVATEGGTPGCFDYYEEACFSTPFTWGGSTVAPATNVIIRALRVGSIVNLLIPLIIINNGGLHVDVIRSTTPLPQRFRPFTTVRGACSTIVYNELIITPNPPFPPTFSYLVTGALGEWDVSPAGIITFGLPGSAVGPQPIASTNFVDKDIDSLTYSIVGCPSTCKAPC